MQSDTTQSNAMLQLNNIEVIYDDIVLVLKGLSLAVPRGQIVALLGANGAGKSTTLKAISGLLKPEDGEVTDGDILFNGESIQNSDPETIVKKGIFQVMEGRRIFEHLTVEENLRAGGYTVSDGSIVRERIQLCYEYFPRLRERSTQVAGFLSGGEQQMLAMARAMMAQPRLLLLDEPSMGLAPVLVDLVFDTIESIRDEGVTILLVEQNAHMALQIASRGYVLQTGEIILSDSAEAMQKNPTIQKAYLGID